MGPKGKYNLPAPPAHTPMAVATPDGGLLYAGIRCINYVSRALLGEESAGKRLPHVTTMSTRINVLALDVSPLWGEGTAKPFALVGDDLSVQVWDCGTGEALTGHKAHQHQQEARDVRPMYHAHSSVLLSYLANGNILSMDATDLVIYCVASNTYCRRPTFLPPRHHMITVLRASPYHDNLFAVGTMAGLVMVCDLRKMGVVYKFSGHKDSVCALSWREVTLGLPEERPQNERWRSSNGKDKEKDIGKDKEKDIGKDKEKSKDEEKGKGKGKAPPLAKSQPAVEEADELFDIYNFEHLDCEFGAPAAVDRKSKAEGAAAEFVGLEKPASSGQLDFVEACESMKAEMLALKQETQPGKAPPVEVTLKDCEPARPTEPGSDDSTISNAKDTSSEGSLEVIQYSSSSDDAVIVDGEAAKPKREVLHHIYHQAEVHAPETPLVQAHAQAQAEAASNLKAVPNESLDSISSASVRTTRPDVLLASIDSSEVTMIWNTNTGAHAGKNYTKNKGSGKQNNVAWLNDATIVSMSRNQLFFWSLEYEHRMLRYKISKDKQYKCLNTDVTDFACQPKQEAIWLCRNTRRICSLDPRTGNLRASYGTVAFGVRAMSECPDDMNKIALGCSDRRLVIFDISQLSSDCLPVSGISVNSSIYCLAWSPDCLQLAFGGFDGIIGIVDVERMAVKTVLRTPHKKEIYSMAWHDTFIYFIVNRTFGYFDLSKPNSAPVMIQIIPRPSYLSVRDKFVFIGTDDGLLLLYDSSQPNNWAHFIRKSVLLSRYVTDIAWCPLEPNKFAVVGNDNLVCLMEFAPETPDWQKLHTFTTNAPKASITSMKWSNSQPNRLLTFHIEGTVCMWDTEKLHNPALTITYHCPMWCGIFLPSNEDFIMCSGKTVSIELINIKDALAGDKKICSKVDGLLNVKWACKSLTQPNDSTLTAAAKKRQRREQRKAALKLQEAKVELQVEKKTEQTPKTEESVPVNNTSLENLIDGLSLDNIPKLTVKPKQHEEPPPLESELSHSRTCFYLAQKELNKSALEKLAIVLTEDADKIDKSVLISKLFSTKVMAKNLIASESRLAHQKRAAAGLTTSISVNNLRQSNTKDIGPLCLSVSTFTLREELEKHMENRTINEWHVSLAPSVSFVFWQQCCRAFAEQLEANGYYMHAAMYLFSVGMQTEAIELFMDKEYYKEALVHARICKPATDPMIKTIINRWLDQLETTGNYGAAALICVLDNEMLRGYSYLGKYRNRTPEIAELMEQIRKIGNLDAVLDGSVAPEPTENGTAVDNTIEA
ncbi:hypothetical protein KR018_007934 [Drosophila ironensis]|nr:hypothetical protein KR018_007934 [Drosophila ironensis]